MKFSLLTPPTDAPSRIPLTRGLPSASALAVNTGGMPNVLPQAAMDPEAVVAPYRALARFAAAGGEVSEQLSNLVVTAEVKKREADNLAVTTGLLAQTSEEVDTKFEAMKLSTDHNTLRPTFNEMWKQVTQEAVAKAPNPEVSRALQIKLAGLKAVKAAEVNDTVRKKTIDFHEATLDKNSLDLTRLITDPTTTEAERNFHVANLENLFLGYAKILPVDMVERVRERRLTTAYNTLAQQAMTKDPEKFLPKSEENPNGGDGYREYSATGKYPAGSAYLNTLIDTTGPNLITRRNAEKRREDERREERNTQFFTESWGQRYDKLIVELDSGDPARVNAASVDADVLLREDTMGKFWTHGMKGEVRSLLRNTRQGGGTTQDTVFNSITTRLLEDPLHVSEDEIRKHGGDDLARTGDRSVASLIVQRRQLLKADDVSQRPDYATGKDQIHTLQAGATDMMALMSTGKALFAPANIAKNRDLYGDALAEYDREARKPEWKTKNLRELGVQIRKKYMPLVYPTMQGGAGANSGVEVPKETKE